MKFRILRRLGTIENVNESEKTWSGLNVPKVSGQVSASGTEAGNDNVTCSKKDRVQDPQNTIEAVKRVSVAK